MIVVVPALLGLVNLVSSFVDNEGNQGEAVDDESDDDEHPLKVEVVEGRLASLLQHPLVLPTQHDCTH